MFLGDAERKIVVDGALRCGVAPALLIDALQHESGSELAQALRIDQTTAEARLAPIVRAVTVEGDWGAGCKLLTDDVRAELQRALSELFTTDAYSASSGVSHG